MRKKTKTVTVSDGINEKVQNQTDHYLQGVENININLKDKKTNNNKSSPVVKDLRLLLNKNKQSAKKEQKQLSIPNDTNINNKSPQDETSDKQKTKQSNRDKINRNTNNSKHKNIKQSNDFLPIPKVQQSINNPLVKQNTKVKQSLSTNKTNSNKIQVQKQKEVISVRKQTSSTKLSQPYQGLSSVQLQNKNNKNKLSHSKQVESKNTKSHSVKQMQTSKTKTKQKVNPLQKSINNLVQKKIQPIKVSVNNNKQAAKNILQILSKNQISPKTNDKNYVKHDCSQKKIKTLIIDDLKKLRTKQNQTQINKNLIQNKIQSQKEQISNSNTVKQLITKLSQNQSKSVKKNKVDKKVEQVVNKNVDPKYNDVAKSPQKGNGAKLTVEKSKDTIQSIKPHQDQNKKILGFKKDSLGLQSKIEPQNLLIRSPSKVKVGKSKSIPKNKKDQKTLPVIIPQSQIQIKQQLEGSNLKHQQEDIKRIKFLKRLQTQKTLIQQRQQQKKHQQQLQRQQLQQKKKQQEQRLKSQQLQKKRRSLSQRIEQIQRRKQQRKNQLIKQNKQYLQKKNQFTLEHKLINQYLQKELQQNQIKQRQLQAKISKMKPSNLLQEIQQHVELIQSYRKLHQSRFMDSDLKYQQHKSRIQLSKLYKSNWYKQIKQHDPLETFQIQEEKKKQQKQLLLMKLDNRKKYSEYVKVNYKPDFDQQSTFKYEKRIIADISADKIRRMGLENLDYSKQHALSQKKFHSQTQRRKDENNEYKNYLQQLKTQRSKKQKPQSEEDFDNMIEKIKSSTTLTKDQKVKKITEIAKKIQSQAKQKQKLFNKTHQKGIKILQNHMYNSQGIKRGASLSSLSIKDTLQPKLKININKTTSKQKQSTDDLLKQIQSKFKLLQKIQNV